MNLEDVLLRDTRANQPLATAVAEGTLYYVTDESVTEQSRAGAWVDYSDTGSGGITQLTGNVTAGPGTGSQVATIANDAVATAKILNSNVIYAKIQNVSATSRVLGRKTAGAGVVEELTLSEILDFISSAAQGDILFRGAAAWQRLAAGTNGQVLTSGGAAADVSWTTPAAGGGGNPTVVTRTITELEIESWATSPIELVAAQGANKIIVPILFQMETDVTVSYTSTAAVELNYTGDGTNLMQTTISPGLDNSPGKKQTWIIPVSQSTMFSYAAFDPRNKALLLAGGSNPTGAGSATARVNVTYMVATVS